MGYEYLSFVLAVESTPLMAASNSGHSDVVNVLEVRDGKMAFDDARKRGYTKIVEALQNAGAKLKNSYFLSIKWLIFPTTALICTLHYFYIFTHDTVQ